MVLAVKRELWKDVIRLVVSLVESLVESKASEEMDLLQKMDEELPCKVQLGTVSGDLNTVMGQMAELQMQ